MYAVIKTGGKQYRVKPGDVLVVEKLAGAPGDKVSFDQVLAIGEGESVTLGAPLVQDASVNATLIETRKGEKLKIFKKIRRQGYRRTRGHRQPESVFRVTSLVVAGKTESWDGEVSLTTLTEFNLRARNLARGAAGPLTPAAVEVETVVAPEGKGKAPRGKAKVVEEALPIVADEAVSEALAETAAAEAAAEVPAKKPAARKAPAAKAPTAKDVAKSAAPKASKAQTKAPPVRRTAPRSGKG